MEVSAMLQEISAISRKYALLSQRTGGCFNIFSITDSSTDEVTVCRVLHELLSPTGSHGQKDEYLKLFLDLFMDHEISKEELKSAKVFREYVIHNGRRIDLVIQTFHRFIPIEVKIFAGDQNRQCYDYFHFARSTGKTESNLIYITPFGTLPSEQSAISLTKSENGYREITTLSFSEDILQWLDLCLKQTNTFKIAPIREIILQFMASIREFTNQMEDDERMEITELLAHSPENMRNAYKIKNSVEPISIELMKKLFKAIEMKVRENHPELKKIINEYDYEAENYRTVEGYYKRIQSTWPGISYPFKSRVSGAENVDIWVRLEIDHHLFIGYCTPLNGKASGEQLTEEELKRECGMDPVNKDGWWGYWEYIPDFDKKNDPNFKWPNDAYFELFRKDAFDEFVDHCAKKVSEFLKIN